VENNNFFEDDEESSADSPTIQHLNLVKIGIVISCDDLRYRCISRPERYDDFLNSERKIEQILCGQSKPIDNVHQLYKSTLDRQPNTNEFFLGQQIFINLREGKKPNYVTGSMRMHHLLFRTVGNKNVGFTFDWLIDDRSLFTRMCILKSTNSMLKIIIRIRKNDGFFRELKNSTHIEEKFNIPVEDVHFNFE